MREKVSRCEDKKMWRWADVNMSRCEDEQMWRWADVKMRRWEGVKMSRCEDERMWRWEDVKMSRCEDERMWRWDVKMRRCFTDPHYWKNPALRRSREKTLVHGVINQLTTGGPHLVWKIASLMTKNQSIYVYLSVWGIFTDMGIAPRNSRSVQWWLKWLVPSLSSQIGLILRAKNETLF